MSSRRRLMTPLPLLALALAGAGPAPADPPPVPDSVYACVFDGTVTTGPPPGQDGMDAIVPDLLAGSPGDTDSGTYTLTAGAVCQHKDADADLDGGADGTFTTRIAATGVYTDLVCTAGTANGSGTVTAVAAFPFAAPGGFEGPLAFDYGITFAGGAGDLALVASNTPAGAAPAENGSGRGVIDLLAPGGAGGDCVLSNATTLQARGSFEVALS